MVDRRLISTPHLPLSPMAKVLLKVRDGLSCILPAFKTWFASNMLSIKLTTNTAVNIADNIVGNIVSNMANTAILSAILLIIQQYCWQFFSNIASNIEPGPTSP